MTFHLIRINIFHYISVAHCSDLLKSGQTQSGVYSIDPDGKGSFDVYCDMRTDGGGWTVFQRRQDGSVDFYRGWSDYKSGFGQLTSEFWLGNDTIHRLTASRASSLRVELEDWNGVRVYAKYGQFNIGDEQAEYRLEANSYSGTAGDSLAYHNNMAFSTKDRDNDRNFGKCAVSYTGAWWYKSCHNSNLNGKYGKNQGNRGLRWDDFRGSLSLKLSEMKLRPQLPQGRVESNNSALTLFDVRRSDSDNYFCAATNMLGKVVQTTLLVVVSLPHFTVTPPAKIVKSIGANLTLNCSATGDPPPVISWKRQGSQLPVGRSQQIDGALVIRDVQKEDAGNYICVATSAGVFKAESGAYLEIRRQFKGAPSLVIERFI